jgi:anti-sigma factor RsiW
MKCEDVQKLLHPFSDGELDVVGSVQIEEHLAGCSECAAQEEQLRSLKSAISSASLYHRAPAGLRTQIQASLRELDGEPNRKQRRSFSQIAAIAAGILLLVGVSAITAMFWSRTRADDDRVAELVVAAHVRSLQANHATDVASTDQHTVKPWFQGKLDFSPPVPDLSAQGFSLIGGRLDYLVDRPVAAIVYRYRLHPINLFVWQAANGDERPVQSDSRQGFHIRSWQHSGMTYWAISDLADRQLDEFVRLFQEQSSVSSR